jgi:hypothetical protein
MTFTTLKSLSGLLTYGQPPQWNWTRSGGHYFAKRDFFCVHWEVHHPADSPDFAHSVRFHVESPSESNDSQLNGIKGEIIEALLSSSLEGVAVEKGFAYKKGSRTSSALIQKNQCTEAFRVTLPDAKLGATPQQNIEIVHAALGDEVERVLERFYETLNVQFGK